MRVMAPLRTIGIGDSRPNRPNSEGRLDDEPMITATGSIAEELRNGMPAGLDSRSGRVSKKKDVGVKKSYMASSVQGNVGHKPLDELFQMFGEKPKSNKTSRGRTKSKASANSTTASSPRSEEESPSPTAALSPERRKLSPQSERGGSPADLSHRVENAWQSDTDLVNRSNDWEEVTRKNKKRKKYQAPSFVNPRNTFDQDQRRETKERYSSHAASIPPVVVAQKELSISPPAPVMTKKSETPPPNRMTVKNPDEDFPPIDPNCSQTVRMETRPMPMKMSDVLKGKKSSNNIITQTPPSSNQQIGTKPKSPPIMTTPVILDSCRIFPYCENEDGFSFGVDIQTIRSIRASSCINCVTSEEEALKDQFNYGQCVKLLSDNWYMQNTYTRYMPNGTAMSQLCIPSKP